MQLVMRGSVVNVLGIKMMGIKSYIDSYARSRGVAITIFDTTQGSFKVSEEGKSEFDTSRFGGFDLTTAERDLIAIKASIDRYAEERNKLSELTNEAERLAKKIFV